MNTDEHGCGKEIHRWTQNLRRTFSSGFIRVHPCSSVVKNIFNLAEGNQTDCRRCLRLMGQLTFRIVSFLSILFLTASVHAASEALRNISSLNREWKFQLGDVMGAEGAAVDDSKWDDANLPHSFSMPYFAANRFYVGYGWYRKHFDMP